MATIGTDLLRYTHTSKKFCVFDTETEGLHQYYSRPWEISWVIFEHGKPAKPYQRYLKWSDLKVSAGAAAHTGFDPKIIEEKGEDPEGVIKDFYNEFLINPEYCLLGQNILGLDTMLIYNCAKRFGLNPDYKDFILRCYDTHPLAKMHKLGMKVDENLPLLYQMLSVMDLKVKGLKTKIEVLCEEFGVEHDPFLFHKSALYDSQKTYEVFLKMINVLEIK
jgi:DNA polymerase III epsilon subunit-like protein